MAPPPDGTQRLSVLHEIALALSGELDRTRLYEGIVRGARRLLGVPLSAVMAWDQGREQLVTEAVMGDVPRLSVAPAELPVLEGRAFLERRTTTLDDYGAQPRAPQFARFLRIQAAVATPLMREGEALGVLFAAHNTRGHRFDAEDLRLLELLAGHVSLALANAETVATATRRLARAEELANSLRGLAEARERDAIAQRTLDCATTVLGADRAALYLIDFSSGDVSFVAGRRLSRKYLEDVANHYRRSVGGLLPLTRAPLYVADIGADPRTRVLHETARREGVCSALIIPLLHRDQVFGALALYHDMVWHYDAEELAQVRGLADQVALALGAAALHQQTWRQLAQLRALDGLVRAVSDPGPEAERCQRGAQALVAGGGATRVWVWQAGGSALAVLARAGSTTLLDSVARDAARASLAAGRAMVHTEGGGDPLVAAPIEHQGNVYGALVLSLPRPAPAEQRPATIFLKFAEELEPEARHEFATTAAGQIATAIANARLYEEARSTGSRLAAVISGMPDGILVFDHNHRLVFFNPKVQEVYGLTGVDLTGWSPDDFVREVAHCFADPRVPHEIARRISERRDVHRIEFELQHPRRRIIERISAPVLSSDGESFGQVVLYHDLTELRDAERTKDNFLAIASHELRAPLAGSRELAGASRRALARDGHADAAAQVDRVDAQLGRLALLIDELGDITLLDAGRLELSPSRFDYAALVEEVVEHARRASERHTIRVALPDRPVHVHADRDRLARVIFHLLGNAMAISPAGGELALEVTCDDEVVETTVGIDLPVDERTTVFDRFTRGSPATPVGGLGLGLYIAREVILRHGGDIRIEEPPDGGVIVGFRIPLQAAASVGPGGRVSGRP